MCAQHKREGPLNGRLLDVVRRPKRWLASVLAVIVIVTTLIYFLRSPKVQHPRTLEGWHIQQAEGVPYSGANSRFVALGSLKSGILSEAPQTGPKKPVTTPDRQAASAAASDAANKLAGSSTAGPSTLGPTTDAQMMPLPPFEPTCIATNLERMDTWGCPVMMCNKHPSCTVHNTSCCAYLNYQMLSFLHDFLASKCLDKEYLVMFGTGLGAVRNQTVIPWTEDLDLGITPLAVQFLELNETRQELWRHGYSLWAHQAAPFPGYWKMCPHRWHPSPHFQAAMVKDPGPWTKSLRKEMAVYTDLWPMWPVSDSVTNCKKRHNINTTELVATPWDASVYPGSRQRVDPCAYRQSSDVNSGDEQSALKGLRRWCIIYASEPFLNTLEPRQVKIGERLFPTAIDQERILPTVYGPSWRAPDQPLGSNHGTWPHIPDGFDLVDALLQKLSLGAWGGMPFSERKKRCKGSGLRAAFKSLG